MDKPIKIRPRPNVVVCSGKWTKSPPGSRRKYKRMHVLEAEARRRRLLLLGATLFFLLANLATDMVYGPEADRPEWMVKSRTYPLLNASGRSIVDWVEARRGHPRVEAGR